MITRWVPGQLVPRALQGAGQRRVKEDSGASCLKWTRGWSLHVPPRASIPLGVKSKCLSRHMPLVHRLLRGLREFVTFGKKIQRFLLTSNCNLALPSFLTVTTNHSGFSMSCDFVIHRNQISYHITVVEISNHYLHSLWLQIITTSCLNVLMEEHTHLAIAHTIPRVLLSP